MALVPARARARGSTLLPGYTHLQRAQAITLGHHLLAYVEMLGRDRGRFLDAARRASECPLGSGALAATSLPIDREKTSAELGFAGPTRNSLDAVSDRDFCAELAFACALLGVHLSRLGEELVLWSTTEFGFVRLGEGHCSGSSLMPQKRNPDIAELLRAKPGRLIGDVVALLTVSKGLALAYNKDLQETQEPFYDAIETTRLVLDVLPGLVAGLEFQPERMREAASDPALGATDLAEHLVRDGVPFRRAHEIVGKLVRHAEQLGVSLRDVPEHDLPGIAPELHAGRAAVPERLPRRRRPRHHRRPGAGPGPARGGAPDRRAQGSGLRDLRLPAHGHAVVWYAQACPGGTAVQIMERPSVANLPPRLRHKCQFGRRPMPNDLAFSGRRSPVSQLQRHYGQRSQAGLSSPGRRAFARSMSPRLRAKKWRKPWAGLGGHEEAVPNR